MPHQEHDCAPEMLLVAIVLAVLQADNANVTAVRGVLEAQVAAWNRGDIDAFMEGYANEETTTFVSGDTITRQGDAPRGRFTLIFRRMGAAWRIIHDHTSSAP